MGSIRRHSDEGVMSAEEVGRLRTQLFARGHLSGQYGEQSALARKIGVSETVIGWIVRGRPRKLSDKLGRLICLVCGIDWRHVKNGGACAPPGPKPEPKPEPTSEPEPGPTPGPEKLFGERDVIALDVFLALLVALPDRTAIGEARKLAYTMVDIVQRRTP